MTDECPNCRPGVTCAACLDYAHVAHLASGFDLVSNFCRAAGCTRCKPLPRNRAEQRKAARRNLNSPEPRR